MCRSKFGFKYLKNFLCSRLKHEHCRMLQVKSESSIQRNVSIDFRRGVGRFRLFHSALDKLK